MRVGRAGDAFHYSETDRLTSFAGRVEGLWCESVEARGPCKEKLQAGSLCA